MVDWEGFDYEHCFGLRNNYFADIRLSVVLFGPLKHFVRGKFNFEIKKDAFYAL